MHDNDLNLTLKITLINNDIFFYTPGSYDRYVLGDVYTIVYFDDVVLDAFNSSQVLMINLVNEESEDCIYD